MRLTINKIEFDIEPVPGALREAVLAEPLIRQGAVREVWEWDRAEGKGKPLIRLLDRGVVPLGNAITFFVPRTDANGVVANNPRTAAKQQERFLEAVSARTVIDLLRALSKVVPLPRVGLPLKTFEPLNGIADYRLRMTTDFSVVRLHSASRNLSAYFFVPGRVAFRALTSNVDEAAMEKLVADKPEMANFEPLMLLPAGGKAAHGIRSLALAERLKELRPAVEAAAKEGADPATGIRSEFARTAREWSVLHPKAKADAKA
ncbi:hypothetical protein [Wenxinia marina]|uniref:Uncharacterized protein n=1 Tax=Wenxinia marina DSM 24838 TaxID=1123501 RepID=A0A0D0PHL9_9RHOB|nr:hypothetical protein [Wenxinia marina]KIQ70881.1 hypothetical protein Wenmar_00255 [Wenxinia marina DSM 24838]GGL56543.1 hypothetical protein GCM10011392_08790 [Wenxinia marina]